MAFVEIKSLSKRFQDKQVLDQISFSIEKGEFMGLVGPNGAGKTTLINLMMGLLPADEGEVLLDGHSMAHNDLALKQRIAYVPQELALYKDASCWENLLYFATLYNLFGQERKEKAEKALEVVGLTAERNSKVKKLSGGMARRLNLACAIMHDPEFLILDEPTVGIDAQSRNFIFEYLEAINAQGVTILYTSHYMEEIEKLCDRVFIIDKGQEIACGTQDQIRGLVADTRKIDFVFASPLSPEKLASLSAFPGVKNLSVGAKKEGKAQLNLPEASRAQAAGPEAADHLQLEIVADAFSLNAFLQALEQDTEILSIDYRRVSLEEVFLALTGRELRA